MTESLPGTAKHQAILCAVLNACAKDESIQTIGVFGSLVRPDCDEYSDIDLDVVIPTEALASASGKIRYLIDCLNATGFPTLLVAWDGDHAAEILLESLDRIDITLHAPEDSKAEVLRDLVLIRGERSSLLAEGKPAIDLHDVEQRLRRLHDKFPILALGVATSLRRGRVWDALLLLQTMREAVMEIYGLARGSTLPVRYFAEHAEKELQQALGETLATYQPDSIAAGLMHIVNLYRSQCDGLINDRLFVTKSHKAVFDRLESMLPAHGQQSNA